MIQTAPHEHKKQYPTKSNNRLPLTYWANLYQKHSHHALCLDIETMGINKPITIIGLYQPNEGIPQITQLIHGQNLTQQNLKQALQNTKLLITFNGLNMDIPRIKKQFPNTIPQNTPTLDLYRIARRLNLNSNLTTLEQTFHINRLHDHTKKKHIAVKLWNQHQTGNPTALPKLLEYNKQDTINLYPLAEELTELILNGHEEQEHIQLLE